MGKAHITMSPLPLLTPCTCANASPMTCWLPLPTARPACPLSQMSHLMLFPLLGDEEIQREEAHEDSDGSEGRGS